MHAFNSQGVITKYDTLNAILKEYANVRLELYEKCRQHQIRALQSELPYHENIVRFIEDQISDSPKIDLRRKTQKQCLEILMANDFTETEAILKLPVSSFTAESIQKHQAKFRSLQDEIDGLQRSTPNNLWIADLQEIDL
jgi:DNA gyrase/topoisomerase IV subunit A